RPGFGTRAPMPLPERWKLVSARSVSSPSGLLRNHRRARVARPVALRTLLERRELLLLIGVQERKDLRVDLRPQDGGISLGLRQRLRRASDGALVDGVGECRLVQRLPRALQRLELRRHLRLPAVEDLLNLLSLRVAQVQLPRHVT